MTVAMEPPSVDSARQAINAIRGYEYQVLAATLAWVDLDNDGVLCLEVAEDYAIAVGTSIEAVQVKDTRASGSVTLNTPAVREAISAFIDLVERNPRKQVQLRFFTTSPIGRESASRDRPGELSGLTYWERVRAGREDVGPLRSLLERPTFPEAVREFCTSRNDEELLTDLIGRISWDCGCPPAANLRLELQQRLAQVLRANFGVPSLEAPRVADILAYRVLQRSALPDVEDRVLSRSELHHLVDFATRVNVRRADFERLLSSVAASAPQPSPGQSVVRTQGLDDPAWVVNASTVPAPKVLVPRPVVEAAVRAALKATGLCFIVGATGVGKSMVARRVASTYPDGARWVDFRDLASPEARERLYRMLALLGGMGSSTIMVEDLNCMVAPRVQLALGQVVEAARRHDMRVLVTCYRGPPLTVLNSLGVEPDSILTCPHFELEETSELVKHLGGDPSVWGRVAHTAGGSGHPQLTHTFVAGMAAREWPMDEIPQIVQRGFTSADLDVTREATRASMTETLREPTRQLLYRLSIASAPFKRSLALALGGISPLIERPGECLDELVGPWIEAVSPDRSRTSPLVRGLGREMLAEEEQRRVHRMIAEEIIGYSPIEAGDIDTILVHGLAGESHGSLFRLSGVINVADDETRRALAGHVALLPVLEKSRPIYPANPTVSLMLRLAQLRLATASEAPDGIADIVHALLRELDAVLRGQAGQELESVVLLPILGNIGIANHVHDWIELLSRVRRLLSADEEGAVSADLDVPAVAALFSVGSAGLASVERLEAIFKDLDALDHDERREMLEPVDPSYADYHLLVHGPWSTQARETDFDAARAVASYQRMAGFADAWKARTLGLQCRLAVANIQDELLGDPESALRTLNEAAEMFGGHPILGRAFGKLHHRAGQSADALACYREAVLDMAGSGPVEATHALRDAAVCAAECEDWATSQGWFLRAQAASQPLETIGLRALTIGLGADAAVVRSEAGDLSGALELLKDTLFALEDLDPDSSLQAAHCHRVVRHAILWLKSNVAQEDTKIEGEPITMRYGACGNPHPVPEIKQRPLGHIEFAWYMLAEIELLGGLDLGIGEAVRQRGLGGQVPVLEWDLRIRALGTAVERLDATSFAKHLLDYVAASAYCHVNMSSLRDTFDVMNPVKAVIPPVPTEGPFDPVVEQHARRAILAYGVQSLFRGRPGGIFELRDNLMDTLGQDFPGRSLFDQWGSFKMGAASLDDEVAAILATCSESDRPPPATLFHVGVHVLEWITQSSFKPFVMRDFAPWLRDQWRRVLQTQRFLLVAPLTSVPIIEDVLQSHSTGAQFAAKLALVAADAVGARLAAGLRQRLGELASRSAE